MKDLGLIGSSTDSSQLSATVSGIIVALSSLIILVASKFGIMIDNVAVTSLAVQIGLVVGSMWTLYGLLRKVLVKTIAPKQ